MTMCSTTTATRDAVDWLSLAASPTFALMAAMAATDGPTLALCGSASSLAPLHGMSAMFVMMSLFHLTPWLTLARTHL